MMSLLVRTLACAVKLTVAVSQSTLRSRIKTLQNEAKFLPELSIWSPSAIAVARLASKGENGGAKVGTNTDRPIDRGLLLYIPIAEKQLSQSVPEPSLHHFNLNNSPMALPRGFRTYLPLGEVGIAFLQFRVG